MTCKKPFIIFVLIELIDNHLRGAQVIETARKLLMRLQPFELQFAFYIDKNMVEYVLNIEEWLKEEQ